MTNQSESQNNPKPIRKSRRANYDLGKEQSMVGPTDEEVENWAERERKRREAWLAGPTDDEKLEWAQRHRVKHEDLADQPRVISQTDEEVENWAERERKRREAWLAGPTEDEKLEWAHRQRVRRQFISGSESENLELDPVARRWRREAILAREGMLYTLWERPWILLSRWIQAGRIWEEEAFRPTRRSRIPFFDDE